jgi:D-lactate dehydrogenase
MAMQPDWSSEGQPVAATALLEQMRTESDTHGNARQVAEKNIMPIERMRADPTVWRNVDGERVDDGRYARFHAEIVKSAGIQEERCFTDAATTFAYGTDASFYRLNPKLVVKVHNEDEIRRILPIALKHEVPVTFRAAGTSLSGQAITDSVLLKLSHTGRNWRRLDIKDEGKSLTVEPGMIGGEVNRALAAYKKKFKLPNQYKIGPDPASIDSCMIGGIVSNNSSGMCCGVQQNTYHTIKDVRVVFMDGSLLDTSDAHSRNEWLASHPKLVQGVVELATRAQANKELSALITRKFNIKCTTGYSINALVDFPPDDPIEIIKHLLVGSEGTLGFISQVTYNTVPEHPCKASAFMVFPDIEAACATAAVLKRRTDVDAVELFDDVALVEAEKSPDMVRLVAGIEGAGREGCAALLIECRGEDEAALTAQMEQVNREIEEARIQFRTGQDVYTNTFQHDPAAGNVFWDMRKGLIPIVGAAREVGTSLLIEDVACEVERLAPMTRDLQGMFKKFNYNDACIIGHALEGNLHLLFSQGFETPAKLEQFRGMMREMVDIVAHKYKGSLKGEHSTGRNISPFVVDEWGEEAFSLMWQVKMLFDPAFMLNPGVIVTPDTEMHMRHLKASPPTTNSGTSEIVDRCIECGFCESNCPAKDLTLTPRQRITVWREINRLQDLEQPSAADLERLEEFKATFVYKADATCAADGMCEEKCPVRINTGTLIKTLRAKALKLDENSRSHKAAHWIADNFHWVEKVVPTVLTGLDMVHRLPFGETLLTQGSNGVAAMANQFDATRGAVPVWNKYMPRAAKPLSIEVHSSSSPAAQAHSASAASALAEMKVNIGKEANKATETRGGIPRKVVYYPSCVTRTMGPARGDDEGTAGGKSVHEMMLSVLGKAGYEIIYPEGVDDGSLCCGMLFDSRGFDGAGAGKSNELERRLREASEDGKIPIVCDTSPCLQAMKDNFASPELQFAMYEPLQFIDVFLHDKLEFEQVKDDVAVHVPCSSKKMKVEGCFVSVAEKCAKNVHVTNIPCCGMAGDRGMRYPELTGSSLQNLDLPGCCSDGYSTSRTCEMSLSNHSDIHFRSLLYLVDEATSSPATRAATEQ